MTSRPYWPGALVLCGLALAVVYTRHNVSTPASAPALTSQNKTTEVRINKTYGRMPLYFIENCDQVDNRVAYYVQGRDTSVFFTSRGVNFTLTGLPEEKKQQEKGKSEAADHAWREEVADGRQQLHLASMMPLPFGGGLDQPEARRRHTLTLEFVGANPAVKPVGNGLTPAVVSYFTGPRDQWKTGLKTYSKLVYPDLWPGIDLVYSGTVNQLKSAFLVKPGADLEQIRLAYRGATAVWVDEAGELEVSTPVRRFHDGKPYVYQEIDGRRVEVSASFALKGTGSSDTHRSPLASYEYGFRVGSYDHSRPLVLDPAIFLYATYIGGGGDDRGLGIAVDSSGNAYVTGQTPTFANGVDAFVAKINAAGTGLVYLDLIGGVSFDAGFDIAVDGAGNAYVTGATSSDEFTFPVFGGPDLTYNGGGSDAFVAKINAAGTALVYSGYIGGSGFDFAEGIALDSSGNAYVEGPTNSSESTFPVTVGPDLTANGRFDIFVTKVKAIPNNPVVTNNFGYCGYIGGAGDDIGIFGRFATSGHIAVDASGNAYISGMTESDETSFPNGNGFASLPGLPGPDQTHNGQSDAFVVKVKADGTGLVYAGYIGGRADDFGFGMAVDGAGNAYLTGNTKSSEATFPVIGGPDLTYNGGTDAFVAKVKADGTGLVYCGYIGGSKFDQGLGLALDSFGNVYVIGHTHSSEGTFPVIGGPDLTYNGLHSHGDAFVVKVKAVPNDPVVTNNFVYCSYIGGAGEDAAFWVAVDSLGNAYVVGDTESDETTFPNGNGLGSLPGLPGPDQTHNGGSDAFVVKIGT